jgi:hypothetical protein
MANVSHARQIRGLSMQSKEHWENIYVTKATDKVSWFQEHARLSLKLIQDAGIPLTAAVVDVGGGASMLVDASHS